MAGTIELAAVFDRAVGDRLLGAERLVLALPQLLSGLLLDCDLHYKSSSRFLAVVVRLASRGYGQGARARLAFWTARAGGLASSLAAMTSAERRVFDAHLGQCDLHQREVAPQDLFEATGKLVTAAGGPADRKRDAYPRPTLGMDAGGSGWEGVSYDRERHSLFIPGALAPPVGDDLAVSVRLPRQERPLEARARVAQVREPNQAGPGAPAGFTLLLIAPPAELEMALAQARPAEAQRAAPRYPVKAPVKVTPAVIGKIAPAQVPAASVATPATAAAPGKAPAPPAAAAALAAAVAKPAAGAARPSAAPQPVPVAAKPAAAARQVAAPPPPPRAPPARPAAPPTRPAAPAPPGAPTARLEYASEQELAQDYLENLSQGGAFVRTRSPPPVGTPLTLEMKLPGLMDLAAPATVVFVHDYGFGVKFELDEAGKEKLAAVIARISARPRRALVVDDDGLVRRMLGDALESRGFEVLTAKDGEEGLRVVAEELLTLDLLVTDVRMPGMGGEAFVRAIRQQGGEEDLAIVAAAAGVDGKLELKLMRAGADAVVDKSLGPELVAQAADAALERKRLVGA
ncbi:MAG TPA: response regulator [Anaeromyxobacteraceae bacterium]|nr:response regulator [Anaeromyxobacteraceae bacterium]